MSEDGACAAELGSSCSVPPTEQWTNAPTGDYNGENGTQDKEEVNDPEVREENKLINLLYSACAGEEDGAYGTQGNGIQGKLKRPAAPSFGQGKI